MSFNLIAILLSLAMMLTGAGGEGQGAEVSRVATLRNVVVTYNGEALRLAPEAHIGVSTDGTRALFDFGVDLDGDALLPIQLVADEAGVKALFVESGEAVAVTAQALEDYTAGIVPLGDMEGGDSELLSFITDEYLPAYGKVLDIALDPEAQAEIRQAAQAVYDKAVTRGEGTPDTVEIEGERYDVTAYSYSLDGAQLGALADAVYAAVPALSDYYDATFKLYSLLPEESGLTEIDSFTALMERTGLDVTMDVEERMSDDGEIVVTDAVLTLDPSAVEDTMLEPEGDAADADVDDASVEDEIDETTEPEGDAEDDEDLDDEDAADAPEPIVLNLHSVQIGDFISSECSCDYEYDGQGVQVTATSLQESAAVDMDMDLVLLENGVRTQRDKLTLFIARDDEGGSSYSASFKNVVQDTSKLELSVYGAATADGASENSAAFGLRTRDANVAVTFDLDVTADAIADAVTGKEASYTIEDLNDEDQWSAPGFTALLMKVGGSLGLDADKLTGEKSVERLIGLMNGEDLPIDMDDIDEDDAYDMTYEPAGDDADYTFVIDEDDGGDEIPLDLDDAPVEDDGELGFPEPRLGWLPKGWEVAETDRDTAYDWVEMSVVDENGEDCAYALFFADPEEGTANYIVQEDGKVVEGREVNVTDFGEGGISVTVRDGGVYGNVMFTSGAIDVETIGKIVAGIEF